MSHGLTPEHLETICRILKPLASRIERVALFGSRARGTHNAYSDIDLVIYGNLAEEDVGRLRALFEDSALPFTVDIQVYNKITCLPLKEHIDRVAQTLFTHEQFQTDSKAL